MNNSQRDLNALTPLLTWSSIPSFEFRPEKKRELKGALMDWFIIAILVGLIMIFRLVPAPSNIQYFRVNDPELSYPNLPEIIDNKYSSILLIIPLVVITITSLLARDWKDFHKNLLTFIESVLFSFTVTTFFWFTIGGLRPKFLEECQPDMSKVTDPNKYYSTAICTGFSLNDLSSLATAFTPRPTHAWPSGHAANILSAGVFLVLFLHGVWRTFDRPQRLWKLFILLSIFVGYLFVGLTRIRDFEHNSRQIITGMVIGMTSAIIAYVFNNYSPSEDENNNKRSEFLTAGRVVFSKY